MKRPLRKTRAQISRQHCPDCEGTGRFFDRDWDDEGQPITSLATCEGCDGCGVLIDCEVCDEPTPATWIEMGSGICGPCRADMEKSA